MRTLFGENILSPSVKAELPDDASSFDNPFTRSFGSSVNASSSTSSNGSYEQNDWLTQHIQNQDRLARETSSRIGSDSAVRYGHARQKGNSKILFMGMSRAGKSSIQKVMFEKFSPAETLYLDTTTKIETASMDSFIKFESAELPSNLPYMSPGFDRDAVFASAGAIIWILDMQDEYFHSISKLIETAIFLLENYPRIHFEVFIHKTDGLSEEYKSDTFRDVRQRVQDELSDSGYSPTIAFYQTSIFDHSLFEAMSKVIQKLLPQLPAIEFLLNKLCSTCRIQKAYLFDTISKIYLATDASPTFLRDYEVCSDYVDVIVDVKQIYGWQTRGRDSNLATDEANSEGSAVGESLITYDRSGNTYIYAREINDYLSLICVMGQGSTADKRLLIDYNVSILHDALVEMFKL